jgi:hypothetical protein
MILPPEAAVPPEAALGSGTVMPPARVVKGNEPLLILVP